MGQDRTFVASLLAALLALPFASIAAAQGTTATIVAAPAAGTTSATFGVIRTASPMRRMQFG